MKGGMQASARAASGTRIENGILRPYPGQEERRGRRWRSAELEDFCRSSCRAYQRNAGGGSSGERNCVSSNLP